MIVNDNLLKILIYIMIAPNVNYFCKKSDLSMIIRVNKIR